MSFRSLTAGNWYAAIFAIVLLAGIIQTYCIPHTVVSVLYDSNGYLLTATQLSGFLARLSRFKPHFEIITDPAFFNNVLHDGPVFALMYAVYFVLCGRAFLPWEWRQLVFPLICCLALSACFVSYITCKMTGSKKWGAAAGLLWGLYPGALASAERYLTELPAATICVACIACLFSTNSGYRRSFLSGVLCGATALIKTALFPGVLAAAAISAVFAAGRQTDNSVSEQMSGRWSAIILMTARRRFVLGFIAGLLCAIAPWAVYTKIAGGKIYLTQQRYPVYNVTLGFDTESNGWNCLPRTPRQLLFSELESPAPILIAELKSDPAGCAVLMFKKISRMFAQPWNDFRHNILGMNVRTQQIYHTLILATAFFGFAFFFAARNPHTAVNEKFGFWLCTVAIAAHLIYLLFQAMMRYAFTAMPFFCILAIYALWALCRELSAAQIAPGTAAEQSDSLKKAAAQLLPRTVLCIACALVLTLISECSESLVSPRHELVISLAPHQKAAVAFDVSLKSFPQRNFAVFVIVDGGRRVTDAMLSLNGHTVQSKLLDPYYYDSGGYAYAYTLDQFEADCKMPPGSLRTWRMVQVPAAWLQTGRNVLNLTAGNEGCTIYGDSPSCRRLPMINCVAMDQVMYSFTNNDPRLAGLYTTGGTHFASWCSAGAQSADTQAVGIWGNEVTGGHISARIAAPLNNNLRLRVMAVLSPLPVPMQVGTLIDESLPTSAFDPALHCSNPAQLRISSTTYRLAKNNSVFLSIPSDLGAADHLQFSVSGWCKNLEPAIHTNSVPRFGVRVSFVPFINGYQQTPLIPAGLPRFTTATCNWTHFQIDDIVPVCALNHGQNYLELSFYPGPWLDVSTHGRDKHCADVAVKDVHVTLRAGRFPDIAGKKQIVY